MRLPITITLLAMSSIALADTAPVSGFARSFLLSKPLNNATITVLETGQTFKTDKNGHFGPFEYPVGRPITLQLEKWGFKTTQSGTFVVPKEGLNGTYDNITFQIPSVESYYLLANIIGAKIDEGSCHFTTTVIKYHKTMDDLPQGEPFAVTKLIPQVSEQPFYFGIYKTGPLKDKTNPFERGLRETSSDGGVAYFNLPPRAEPYIVTAEKNGIKFTEATFTCKPGAFINISPPSGPMVVPHRT